MKFNKRVQKIIAIYNYKKSDIKGKGEIQIPVCHCRYALPYKIKVNCS